MRLLYCHMTAFFVGSILDLIIGDPYWMPHPVRLIGRLISALEKKLLDENASGKTKQRAGAGTCVIVISLTAVVTLALLLSAYLIHPFAGIVVESILTCYLIAARSLAAESMKVYNALESGTIKEARKAVSMIVGRDTDSLDRAGVTRAAVETVAENTSDGVIAPMLYAFIGGPVLGFIYKAINTMDSMIGYKNERYGDFGRAAAKTDDAVNFLPSRLSAYLMTVAAYICRGFSGKDAFRIYRRDRYNHKSPNSAQTESVCAGALGVKLGGPSFYFGQLVEKPSIGDAKRDIKPEDIKKSIRLMYMTEFLLCLVFAFAAAIAICFIVNV